MQAPLEVEQPKLLPSPSGLRVTLPSTASPAELRTRTRTTASALTWVVTSRLEAHRIVAKRRLIWTSPLFGTLSELAESDFLVVIVRLRWLGIFDVVDVVCFNCSDAA